MYAIPFTPNKSATNSCFICESCSELIKINGDSGKVKNLAGLLWKFIELHIVDGFLCRGCERQLLSLEKKSNELKEKMKRSRLKRVAYTPAKGLPVSKSAKRELFQNQPTPELTTASPVPTLSQDLCSTESATANQVSPLLLQDVSSANIQDKLRELVGCVNTPPQPHYLRASEQNDIARCVASTLSHVAETVLNIPALHQEINCQIARNLRVSMSGMKARKHGDVSYLMRKDYKDLHSFEWSNVVLDMIKRVPDLLFFLVCAMVSEKDIEKNEKIAAILPKVGTIFGIVAQNYNCNLSRVQRVVSLSLADNICDQKVHSFYLALLQKCMYLHVNVGYEIV